MHALKPFITPLAVHAASNPMAVMLQGHWSDKSVNMPIKYTRDRNQVPIDMATALTKKIRAGWRPPGAVEEAGGDGRPATVEQIRDLQRSMKTRTTAGRMHLPIDQDDVLVCLDEPQEGPIVEADDPNLVKATDDEWTHLTEAKLVPIPEADATEDTKTTTKELDPEEDRARRRTDAIQQAQVRVARGNGSG